MKKGLPMSYWNKFYSIRKNFTHEQWEQISADLTRLVDLRVENTIKDHIRLEVKNEVMDQFGECLQRFHVRLFDLGKIEEKQKEIVKEHEFLQRKMDWVITRCTCKCEIKDYK